VIRNKADALATQRRKFFGLKDVDAELDAARAV
jgi:hypothetical protein